MICILTKYLVILHLNVWELLPFGLVFTAQKHTCWLVLVG